MALALRLAAYLSCTGRPMGLASPRQGDFSPWRCFLSFGPRRTRGPLSVACGAAEHAEVHSVGRMTVAIGGAKARRSAALEPCAASRCRM